MFIQNEHPIERIIEVEKPILRTIYIDGVARQSEKLDKLINWLELNPQKGELSVRKLRQAALDEIELEISVGWTHAAKNYWLENRSE